MFMDAARLPEREAQAAWDSMIVEDGLGLDAPLLVSRAELMLLKDNGIRFADALRIFGFTKGDTRKLERSCDAFSIHLFKRSGRRLISKTYAARVNRVSKMIKAGNIPPAEPQKVQTVKVERTKDEQTNNQKCLAIAERWGLPQYIRSELMRGETQVAVFDVSLRREVHPIGGVSCSFCNATPLKIIPVTEFDWFQDESRSDVICASCNMVAGQIVTDPKQYRL
jgi:hypothetical protein